MYMYMYVCVYIYILSVWSSGKIINPSPNETLNPKP